MADQTLTPAQAFAEECRRPVKHMCYSPCQQWRGEMEVKHLLRFAVHRSNFTSTAGTVGMVNPHPDACANVSVFLWLIEMSRRAGINPLVETVLDAASAHTEHKTVQWYNVLVPVPPHQVEEFNNVCQAHILGKAPGEEEEDEQRPRGRGRPKKSKAIANPDKPTPKTHRASWRRVDAKVLKDAVQRGNMCDDSTLVNRINFDVDTTVFDATDAPAGVTTIPMLFDLEAALERDIVQTQLENTNAPAYAREAGTYLRYEEDGDSVRKFFRVPDCVYEHAPWTMRNISCADRMINPCADSLHEYTIFNIDVTREQLAARFGTMARFNGQKNGFESMTDEEIDAMFIGEGAPYSKYSHTIEVTAKNPLSEQRGITDSENWKNTLYPVQELISRELKADRQSTIEAVAEGRLASTEVFKVHGRVATAVKCELETETLGTVPAYREMYADHKRLKRQINDGSEVSKMAQQLLYYEENAAAAAAAMPSFDAGLLSISDAITNFHQVTAQQLSVIMKLLLIMMASAKHEFAPVVAVALFGKSDVGKTYCIKKTTSLLPPSMQEAENDSSEKAWVLDGTSPFKFCWMDEIGTGISENGRSAGKSRDSKNMQAGMSNAVMSYKQYNRGSQEGGLGDHLRVINVDCRKTYAITSNRRLNDAMMSRVESIPTYEDKADIKGRSKLEMASINGDSMAAQATSLMVQYIMTGQLFVWHYHACGGSLQPVDIAMFEVYVGMSTAVLKKEAIKCRAVDRLKSNSTALMIFGFVNELFRKRQNQHILDDFEKLTAFIIARCSVVPLRAIEVAYSLSKPTAEFEEAELRLLSAVKKLVKHDQFSYLPAEDNTQTYYQTDIDKMTADTRIYNASEMMGNETNGDILKAALTQLECSNNKGQFSVKYELVGDKLHVIKDIIDDSRVLTDTEQGIVRMLRHIMKTTEYGTLWRYEHSKEKHVLFSGQITQALESKQGETITNARVREFVETLDYNEEVRGKALCWLQRAGIKDNRGKVVDYVIKRAGVADDPFFGMNLFDDGDTFSFQAEKTREDGPVPGKMKKPVCMPNAMCVPIDFLKEWDSINDKAKERIRQANEFSSILHAVSGEAKPGDELFRMFSAETDHLTASARTSTLGEAAVDKVTYRNPRVMTANNVFDKSIFDFDAMHPEDKVKITVKKGARLYQRRVELRVKQNTGVSLEEWESYYGLPPLFDSRVPADSNDEDAIDTMLACAMDAYDSQPEAGPDASEGERERSPEPHGKRKRRRESEADADEQDANSQSQSAEPAKRRRESRSYSFKMSNTLEPSEER